VKHSIFALALVAVIAGALFWLYSLSSPLTAIVSGGSGPPTVVLLHGYGSRAEDWQQFDTTFALPPNTRLVFPQAPLRGPFTDQRGWWWLHLEDYIPKGKAFPDYSHANPGGIKIAATLVRGLLAHEQHPIILGGFSQGAMTSAEIAFQTDQELAGLILLGGTPVNEEAWAEHFAGRRHLPIFIAHGRNDTVLSFEMMERFAARLTTFGLDVTWRPHDGGHGIPDEVISEINGFVRRVARK
jgi:phospholipase/carboxylesterase